jgi:ABC-2 type transport system permease protein
MNAQTNAVSESRFGTAAVADPAMRPTRPVYWSVRRELWENRSIYIAPLIGASLVLIATIIGSFQVVAFHTKGLLWAPGAPQQQMIIEMQCDLTGALVMLATFLVAIFYSLDALYGERRDRSILFWKSLPVSDTVTVLAKASIPIIIIPLLAFAITVVTQCIVIAIDAATLLVHGRSLAVIGQVPVLHMQTGLLYHLVAVHALWYAPIFAWFLLVSAWAPRAPILWAFLPPLAIVFVEKIAFNTSHFGNFLLYRISQGPSGASLSQSGMKSHLMAAMAPVQFLASPGLWGGLFVAALFLAAAIQLRRYRTPS